MTRNKRERKPRLPEGDDGHTIANMNVEGMPWYKPERTDLPPENPNAPKDGLTRRQRRMYTASALKAGLLVAGVMCLGMVAFVAFCVFVWFR